MKRGRILSAFVFALQSFYVLAQLSTSPYTDPKTGISGGYFRAGGFSILLAVPSDLTAFPDEFIVQLTGSYSASSSASGGWSGISVGGNMVTGLLLLANFPVNGTTVSPILSITSSYSVPKLYTGPSILTTLDQSINATHYQVTYRCQQCTSWNQGGVINAVDFTAQSAVWGYGLSSRPVQQGGSVTQHNLGYGSFAVQYADIRAQGSDYAKWIKLGQSVVTTSVVPPKTTTATATTASATTTSTTVTTSPQVTGIAADSYDYIIIGSGAGGQVAADRLSESGKYSVLLVERGPPSTFAHGGRDGSAWVQNNNLTRFDVPGLCNIIWSNASVYLCDDYPSMGGCLLGGGTAINAGLFWKPTKEDFDNVFPTGWKAKDVAGAINRVFTKIPSTSNPANDGQRYFTREHEIFAPTLKKNGWKSVDANSMPNLKTKTFTYPPFMFINGERGGPLATYTLAARSRKNFKILFNTMGERVIRKGKTVTGVEVVSAGAGGYTGVLKLNPRGRVIVSSGTFGSPKILWRSGIGSEDMLKIVSESPDGAKMVPKEQWINLPVGYNLMDHTATIMVLSHPNITAYDYDAAWDNPVASDLDKYLSKRQGYLATAAPGFPITLFDTVVGSDGSKRSLQYTVSQANIGGMTTLVIYQYLGNGLTKRGRLGIASNLNTVISESAVATTGEDNNAIVTGLYEVHQLLSKTPGVSWLFPTNATKKEDFEAFVSTFTFGRGSNHWMGSCKLGTDDGRKYGGIRGSVVDVDAKVYGTDNLFVVDASIFPGMVTANPTASILVAAEHAVARILSLPGGPAGSGLCLKKNDKCGGRGYSGPSKCCEPLNCRAATPFVSKCL